MKINKTLLIFDPPPQKARCSRKFVTWVKKEILEKYIILQEDKNMSPRRETQSKRGGGGVMHLHTLAKLKGKMSQRCQTKKTKCPKLT